MARCSKASHAPATLLGPDEEEWDLLLILQYPSLTAFQELTKSEEYLALSELREEFAADYRLVYMQAP